MREKYGKSSYRDGLRFIQVGKPSVDAQQQMEIRNQTITDLLHAFGDVFVKRLRRKERLKAAFFMIAMLLLAATLTLTGFILWNLAKKPSQNTAAFITATIGIVTALLGLPTIIANYLFNKHEDDDIVKLFSKISEQNLQERTSLIEKERDDEALAAEREAVIKKSQSDDS